MLYLLAYLLAAVIGYLGYRARALTVGGGVAACVVGGTIFAFGGLGWAALLVLFFVSSSLLSFFKAADEGKRRASETFDKGGTRDAAQVLANGGVAAVAALLCYFVPSAGAAGAAGAFVGALSAATADTWATEIGVLSRQQPRLVSTLARVAPGTSGGVTPLGTGAAVAGGLFIGLYAAVLGVVFPPVWFGAAAYAVLLAGLLGGTAGSLADSLMGATVQASYFCPTCGKPTESRVHRCGTPTRLVHGYAFINNDLVNLAATVTGALLGGAVMLLLR